MNGNIGRSEEGVPRTRTRAIVFRCPEGAYDAILNYLRERGDVYIVFSRTSFLRLVIKEEGW
jgi:hypothetical protein